MISSLQHIIFQLKQLKQYLKVVFHLFTKCITKIDGTTIDDDIDLDLVMPTYNLIEYSSNYSKATGNLWFHSKVKMKLLILMLILLILIILKLFKISLNY